MRVLRHSLLMILLFLAACAPMGGRSGHETVVGGGAPSLWSPCTPNQALMWEQKSEQNPSAAFHAVRCYAVLARNGKTKAERLTNAVKGRKLAENAVAQDPDSGTACYLAAYLAGLEAENNSLKGLALVPVIERGALAASGLNPALDHGGPDRMLGELYLRAPEPPVSIGDLDKAILHYRRAVSQDPDFVENRLGLAEAYLEDEDPGAACEQLQRILTRMPPGPGWERTLKKTTNLMKRLCGMEIQKN
ncbi:MAG: tetratricopeptide repeat protein [Deltaproteobacteria bacterium]|nr:tetratricopeptide repeat protein [Deltaproteobacteria bacterium]